MTIFDSLLAKPSSGRYHIHTHRAFRVRSTYCDFILDPDGFRTMCRYATVNMPKGPFEFWTSSVPSPVRAVQVPWFLSTPKIVNYTELDCRCRLGGGLSQTAHPHSSTERHGPFRDKYYYLHEPHVATEWRSGTERSHTAGLPPLLLHSRTLPAEVLNGLGFPVTQDLAAVGKVLSDAYSSSEAMRVIAYLAVDLAPRSSVRSLYPGTIS